MIKEIAEYLDQVDLTINITKSNGKLVVSVLPKPNTDDPAKNRLTPFVVNGDNPSDVEETVVNALTESLPQIAQITNSMNHYMDSVKEMEANAKMKEEEKKKAKELNSKITDKLKGFDELLKNNLDEAKKVVDAVVKLDANNKDVIKAKDSYAKAKASSGGDLFSIQEEKASVVVPTVSMSEEQIEMISQSKTPTKIYI